MQQNGTDWLRTATLFPITDKKYGVPFGKQKLGMFSKGRVLEG